PSQAQPRCAAAVLERAQGRHEPRRSSSSHRKRGGALQVVAAPTPEHPAWTHLLLADLGAKRDRLRGLDAPRPSLHRQLVAVARRRAHPPHDPRRPARARRFVGAKPSRSRASPLGLGFRSARDPRGRARPRKLLLAVAAALAGARARSSLTIPLTAITVVSRTWLTQELLGPGRRKA